MTTKFITLLFTACLLFFYNAPAQLLFKPNAAMQQVLQKIITDFPNQLQNVKGSLIQENAESSDYNSNIIFPGAEYCTVTQYKSVKNKNRSWQAVMPETENFAAAKKQYRDLFLQIKNWGIQLPGCVKKVKAKCIYDEPTEQKKFAGSIFKLDDEQSICKDVKIEVALQYTITGWQVSIYVYDKKEDDEIIPEDATTR
jgi:hypothetical protein